MILRLILLLSAIVACQCSVIHDAAAKVRSIGNLNRYYLYTRENDVEPQVIRLTVASVRDSLISSHRVTVIIVHGHMGGPFKSLNPAVKDALLASEDVNVIVVDWEIYAGQSYSNAVRSVSAIADGIANFITFLVQQDKVSLKRLHLVGFDLGAHVIGQTGRALNGEVARITGLDPSASQWGSSTGRLDINDAVFVEVIHTDSDGLLANGIGTAIGDVDFYPNGGGNQPGCLLHSCSHNRSWELFASSLKYNHFAASRCSTSLQLLLNTCRGDVLHMGNNELSKNGSGRYRVSTSARYPY